MSEHSYPVSIKTIGFFYGLACAFFCYRYWQAVDASASSTAAIGYIFVPVEASVAAIPFAGVGYAAGSIARAWRTRQRRHLIIASVGAMLTVAYFGYEATSTANDRELAATIVRVESLDAAGLAAFFENDKHRSNRFVLAAIAMHPAVSSETLARIAALDDGSLHKKFGGPRE